ncbi:MAG TPA: ABC transporter permease [Candidatus Acidoferrum sp.]|jgi:peptide/nickel transport system permease protein|nr:ABC transporter permease [Candidatus Acidoferrum sp.]
MAAFLTRRVLFGILVLWIISVVVFVMFFVTPHDPARLLAGRQASASEIIAIRHNLGLDRPVLTQYFTWMGKLLHGDLGFSYRTSQPVTSLLASRLPVTASLAFGAAIIWLVLGVSAGVLAAIKPRTIADRAVTFFALFFYSMPTFLLGLLFLFFLFFKLYTAGFHLFPGGGYIPLTQDPIGWADHLILPWFTYALVSAAVYSRLTRGTMIDVLGEDYIRTARSKGISEGRVIVRHALRSALTPVVTQFGIDLGTLLGGAIITENVFGLPGLGQLAVQSITDQNLPVIIGIVIVASFFIVVANIGVDLLYGFLDPRVRLT